jgi:prepilin-type N-terminal cleavage/methylation domain-containing protein
MSTGFRRSRFTARLTRHAARPGFSLIEILIVIVMISLIALVAIPRFASGSARRSVESARMRTAAALSTARQAAIQKGETVHFMLRRNRVSVFTAANKNIMLLSPTPLDTLYQVTAKVGTSDSVLFTFNARGFANVGSTKKIRLTRPGVADDSLMVLITGMVQR